MRALFTLLAALVLLPQIGCGGNSSTSPTSPSGTTGTTGTTGPTTSHNAGRDCTSCHSFTAAGTVYKPDGTTVNPGAIVRLTTQSAGGGTVVASLTADGSGNFYTSTPIGFGSGLYVTATNSAGSSRAMGATITSGACNRCHSSMNRIVTD